MRRRAGPDLPFEGFRYVSATEQGQARWFSYCQKTSVFAHTVELHYRYRRRGTNIDLQQVLESLSSFVSHCL
jgi:hypothetical protein